ncbi:hypothetical protein SPF06_13255 [Sinomonas sp. JGH33]|uniref:Uncharacterized protein n=1 Tax=Sinomonas terricola TaxID=3110330 RepID=A0ABU5T7S8_9MICC|nr:hypothetical protein [Sinomonas sp. JGH33]MEA5455695.1 hypothetical protein [Sinomonas sp. JGH33]
MRSNAPQSPPVWQEVRDRVWPQDRSIAALVEAGLSEELAQQQIDRLAAGDIWCG